MPFDGSGGFLRTQNWQADAAAGIKIVADRHDNEDDNFANGLSSVITKDGQTSLTAHIPFNGFRATGLGNPVDPQDAATKTYADSIRNFPTAIHLTGGEEGTPPVSKAFIGFDAADLAFGARKGDAAANPVTYDRFVWSDNKDLTPATSDRMLLYFGGGTGVNFRCLPPPASPGDDTFNLWHGSGNNGPVFALRGQTYPNNPGGIEFYTNNAGTLVLSGVFDGPGNLSLAGQLDARTSVRVNPVGGGNSHLFLLRADGSEGGLLYYDPLSDRVALRWRNSRYIWLASDGFHAETAFYLHPDVANNSVINFQSAAGLTVGIVYSAASTGQMVMRAGNNNMTLNGTGDASFQVPGEGTYRPGVGGPWLGTSDARIKNVIDDYGAGLAEILALNPIRCTFKGNDTMVPPSAQSGPELEPGPQIVPTVPYANSPNYAPAVAGTEFVGLIAQDVEVVFPDMVKKREGYIDGEPVDDLRSIDIGPLTYAFINAFKTIDARLTALEGT